MGNWIAPIDATTEHGVSRLKQQGFNDSEIKTIRDAFYFALNEYFFKRGQEGYDRKTDHGQKPMPDPNNFHGWGLPIGHILTGTESPKEKAAWEEVEQFAISYMRKNFKGT